MTQPQINPKFGGIDLAKRVDHSALEVVTLKEGVLYHTGEKHWDHVNYKVVADDLLNIQREERMNIIGADRTGVGDAVIELFSRELPIEPIITTMQRKLEIIRLVQGLFQNDKLMLHPTKSEPLVREILEQEERKSDAGNILYRHPSGTHDDRFWALGYACFVASRYLGGIPRTVLAVAPSFRDLEPSLDF